MDYGAYERLFNSGDDAALLDAFFHEDCEFVATTRALKGRKALKDFLAWAHEGVREVMRPQLVIQEKDHLFVEVDMDFHATKERPDFPFGHMRPGDLITVKFFVTYYLRDGKVARLNSATWPPEYQVTKLPRLGAHPSQLAAFHAYIAAFSNGDCERFTSFYTDDVVLQLASIGTIEGKQGIANFYSKLFRQVREGQIIHAAMANDDAISLDSTTCFTAIADAPDFPVMPLKKGEQVRGQTFVHYTLRGGLISRIHVARAGPMEKVVPESRPR
ncbi:MAG: nuclear transport factor 2 family protein [Hyphomonadaceae bacterium]|nr:nuclear transport factor 2 family protein [Hyphomonadaceae bacterium]